MHDLRLPFHDEPAPHGAPALADGPATHLPLLSIVVLVYNTAQYLRECFDSLLAQDYANIEIIAIDDDSDDGSWQICCEYETAHPRLRCLRKTNEGGAVAGNLGMSLARGEYVALVDSDDVVPPDGYRQLMAAAVAERADIAIGRAARLREGQVLAGAFLYEPFVWRQPRSLAALGEFPYLIHDCFYWNKVFRTAFLHEHGLGMVPGLLYADRPFVHRAYYLSRRTTIVPALVYYWRQRPAGAQASISQSLGTIANFEDRIRSFLIEWDEFADLPEAQDHRRMVAVYNLQRALLPLQGIASSPAFRAAFVTGVQRLLQAYGDLDFSALGVRKAMYLELIRRGWIEELCFMVGDAGNCRTVELDDGCYWSQPLLDNPERPLPREGMRLRFPTIGFFRVSAIEARDGALRLVLDISDRIMAECDVHFELQSVHDARGHRLQPEGRVEEGRWAYRLDLAQAAPAQGLYGVVLTYSGGPYAGHYRIGRQLATPELCAALPLEAGDGQPFYSQEVGGLGLRVGPPTGAAACGLHGS